MKNAILIILDGYGEGRPGAYNAVQNANTPTLAELKKQSHSLLDASGEAVGLFKGDLGGSEVGHLTIGSGKINPSTHRKIRDDMQSKRFEKNEKILKVFDNLKKTNSSLHLIGMMSDKNVHSNIYDAFKIIEMAKNKAKHIFLHLITDGRDTSPNASLKYLKLVNEQIEKVKNCEIASISGRAYAMDREQNLDRTQKAFDAMFETKKTIEAKDILIYLKTQHKLGNNDQFIEPVHVATKQKFAIGDKDVLFFFNFREDRLRQIVKMSSQLGKQIVTLANVDSAKTTEIYPAEIVKNTLCEHLSKLHLRQMKISESTKYAHLTYFFNGGREKPFPLEERVHIPSEKVINFATTPKMKAKEIADETIKAIKQKYNAIFVNFSNPDMLGHTGDYEATVKSLEFMDKCLRRVLDAAIKNDYVGIVTADHGNADQMRTKDNLPHMAHTLSKVFCVAFGKQKYKMKKSGGLKDVAPTMLDLMGVKPNKSFEGSSLIIDKRY